MSSHPFFIPEFVLCANSSLFSFKIANEPSEFRNYLNELIRNPKLTEKYEMKKQQVSPECRRITRNIEEAEDMEADEMTVLLFRQASERYKTLEVRDEDIQAEKMRQVLVGREEIGEFDEELYRRLIKQILVYKDDSVEVVFYNNNRIKIGYRDL